MARGCEARGACAPHSSPEIKPEPEIKREPEIKEEPFTIRGYFGLDK